MPKIVVVGSTRFEPYDIIAVPRRLPNYTNDEKSYQEAFKLFKPAIDICDEVWVYFPDGIGEHTTKDMMYALSIGKRVSFIATHMW